MVLVKSNYTSLRLHKSTGEDSSGLEGVILVSLCQ